MLAEKAELIEYDYTYVDFDSCKGFRDKEASNRAILFLDNKNQPIAIAIPENGKLKFQHILLLNGKLVVPRWTKKYTIMGYEPAPFQSYRVVKPLTLSPQTKYLNIDSVMRLVIDYMKMDDLRKILLETIRAESKDFPYRI
jgi:hypothetical protein